MPSGVLQNLPSRDHQVVRQLNFENNNILRDYLGYYGHFVSEQFENWCPDECKGESEIFEHPMLSSYCTCEGIENKWHTVQHDCAKKEIFDRTKGRCHQLPGKGSASCIMKGHKCPNNETGIRKHPDGKLFQNYLYARRIW
ncbi:hypothetical protein JTB14_008223 [Gonioctena quinquepunctata]|nr:hypothetical protein JTB14_008223 [Gonioctena quinquepunctata]